MIYNEKELDFSNADRAKDREGANLYVAQIKEKDL